MKAAPMVCAAAIAAITWAGVPDSAPKFVIAAPQRIAQATQSKKSSRSQTSSKKSGSKAKPNTKGTSKASSKSRGVVTPTAMWKPKSVPRKWRYIVLHHTAAEAGSVRSIHETHKRRLDSRGKPWLGIGYHFVIGNGKGMKDGEIQPTFRWSKQLHGAHAGIAKYNELGIGIVLVGNFEKKPPTKAQIQSAQKLVKSLRTTYRLDTRSVVTHGQINRTACPGRHFSLARITGERVRRGGGKKSSTALDPELPLNQGPVFYTASSSSDVL